MKNMNLLHAALIVGIALSSTACFKTREDIERENSERDMQQQLHKNVYEANESAHQAQTQLGRLQGKIEEVEHFHRKDTEEQRKAIQAMNEKIAQLEEKAANTEKLQSELVEEMKKMKTENLRLMTEAAPIPAGKKSGSEKSHFKSGMQSFQEKNYGEAAEHFQKVVDAGPKSKDYVKANFYLGQSYFAQKQYAEAIVAYSAVYEKDAKEPFWKKSTLRIAESFRKMGKKKDAKPFAQALVEKFPNSPEAQQAKKYIN